MALRTTKKKVEEVLTKDYDCQWSLQGFMETANNLVTSVAACAVAKGEPLSSATLELLERWVSAHYYATSDRPFQENSTSKSSAKYQGRTGMGLESTYYGQTALGLDPSGCLAAITKRNRLRVAWLGKPPSEQIDYSQRD